MRDKDQRIKDLEARIAQLEARIATLEAKPPAPVTITYPPNQTQPWRFTPYTVMNDCETVKIS